MDYEPIEVYKTDIKQRLVRIETILNSKICANFEKYNIL